MSMLREKMAWLSMNGSSFILVESHNIKAGDMKKITTVIDDNADIIVKRWEEHLEK